MSDSTNLVVVGSAAQSTPNVFSIGSLKKSAANTVNGLHWSVKILIPVGALALVQTIVAFNFWALGVAISNALGAFYIQKFSPRRSLEDTVDQLGSTEKKLGEHIKSEKKTNEELRAEVAKFDHAIKDADGREKSALQQLRTAISKLEGFKGALTTVGPYVHQLRQLTELLDKQAGDATTANAQSATHNAQLQSIGLDIQRAVDAREKQVKDAGVEIQQQHAALKTLGAQIAQLEKDLKVWKETKKERKKEQEKLLDALNGKQAKKEQAQAVASLAEGRKLAIEVRKMLDGLPRPEVVDKVARDLMVRQHQPSVAAAAG